MRNAILAMVLVVLATAVAVAQTSEESWENLTQLRVGQKIQVVDIDLKSHNGTFLSFSEEAISLRVGKKEIALPRQNVLRVSNREKTKRWRNVLLGAAIMGAAGLGIGAAMDTKFTEKGEGNTMKKFLTPIGLAAGAALGAAVPSYQTIYRAKP